MKKRVIRAGLAAAAAGAVALIGAPIVFAGGASSSAAPLTVGHTYFGLAKPACAAPKKGAGMQCLALEREIVKQGTRGARAFVLGSGLTASGTVGQSGGLTPADLAKVYGLATTGGAGQTVAVVDAFNDPNINNDLQTFDATYGLAACSTANGCLRVVGEAGTAILPANDTTGWSAEESLDVETVHSVCQGCQIILVEANSTSSADLSTAEHSATVLNATEISNSFGGPESAGGFTPSEMADFNVPGKVIVASSGDDGYDSFDTAIPARSQGPSSPQEPASFNTVISVGGTSLFLNQAGGRQSETVWNNNGPQDMWGLTLGAAQGAGGGGCSTVIAAPRWQTFEKGWANTACGTQRLVADVSALADPFTGFDIYDSYDPAACTSGCPTHTWTTFGGTSLAAPIVAATFALAGGARGVPYPALTLYGHPGSLYDVTVGGNGVCDGEGAPQCLGLGANPNLLGYGVIDCDYPASGPTPSVGDAACDAGAGYDGPSGLGTPNGLAAFVRTGPTAAISGPAAVKHGVLAAWSAAGVRDPFPGGTVGTYRWNWGDGTATTTAVPSAAHKYATGGVKKITLTLSDNYGMTNTAVITKSVTVS